jgi:hypothetical protein
MEAYQERVLAERDELSERLDKLRTFLNSAKFDAVPRPEQVRMTRQYLAMSSYLDVLNERIAAFMAS